jgi:hypothetical protein
VKQDCHDLFKRYITFLFIFVTLSSCSRDEESSRVRIQFPPREAGQSSYQKPLNLVSTSNSQWSGEISQISEVDCFAVFVGGAEEINQRNFCDERDTGNRLVNFGEYYGAIDRDSGVIEIELDANVERELTILGMGSNDGQCINFQGRSPLTAQMTHPRLLFQDTLVFEPGAQTLDVAIPAIFNASIPQIDFCEFDSTEQPPSAGEATLTFANSGLYDYGSQTLGTSVSAIFTVSNTGTGVATALTVSGLSGAFQFTGGSYPGTAGSCGSALTAGSSCVLDVTFAPTVVGVQMLTLTLSYQSGATLRSITRNLQGDGFSQAVLAIDQGPTFDYGNVVTGTSSNQLFTVTNSGSVAATAMSGAGLATPFIFNGATYPGTSGDCGTTLAAGASCLIEVSFAPGGTGFASDTILIDYNDGVATQQASRNVQGNAVAPASLTISESDPYDFGLVATGGSNSHLFTVTNSGGFQATAISEVGLAAPFQFVGGSYPGTGGTCGTNLPPAGTCFLNISYNPTVVVSTGRYN